MARQTPFTAALTARNTRTWQPTKRKGGRVRGTTDPTYDSLTLGQDRTIRPGQTDARSERPVTAFAVASPGRDRGVLAKDWRDHAPSVNAREDLVKIRQRSRTGRGDARWADVVAQNVERSSAPVAVRSAEVKPPIVRSFTGKANQGAQDARGTALRDNVSRNWRTLHGSTVERQK